MRIGFRFDSSELIGAGHASRCTTLADELSRRGAEVAVCTRGLLDDDRREIESRGYPIYWLGQGIDSEIQDAGATIAAIGDVDVLVVDHYGLGAVWEIAVRMSANAVVVIDDLANRVHDADLIVDSTYPGIKDRYEKSKSSSFMLGPRYAFIAPRFRRARNGQRLTSTKLTRLAVSLGQGNSGVLLDLVAGILSQPEFVHLRVDLVLPRSVKGIDRFSNHAKSTPRIRILYAPIDLARLFSRVDVALTGGGVTLLERLCIGVPGVAICLAENQVPSVSALTEAGATLSVPFDQELDPNALSEQLTSLLEEKEQVQQMIEKGKMIVDGFGAGRVAEFLAPTIHPEWNIRQACMDDVGLYFDWVNEPSVRANSINESLVSWEDHDKWFMSCLNSPRVYMWVAEVWGIPVAQVRLQPLGQEWALDFSVDVAFRGRGWASEVIRQVLSELPESVAKRVVAEVKPRNQASMVSLTRAGFERLPDSSHPEGLVRFGLKQLH